MWEARAATVETAARVAAIDQQSRFAPITDGVGRVIPGQQLVAGLIFVYWVIHENLVFINSEAFGGYQLWLVTSAIKVFLPLWLLVYAGVPPVRLIGHGRTGLYALTFGLLVVWSAVPTLVSGDPLRWLKLLPRVLFFFTALSVFYRWPAAFTLFAKCVVVYVMFALLQYVLVYTTGAYENPTTFLNADGGSFNLAGPFGLFGNVASLMYFYDLAIDVPYLRLSGLWMEPSQAAGAAFAAFFLARYVASTGGRRLWRAASFICLAAGFLSLSNAGYLAIALAITYGAAFAPPVRGMRAKRVLRVLLLPFAIGLIALAFGGRAYVAENLEDNPLARAVTGVRFGERTAYDPSGGRLDLLWSSLATARERTFGVGIQDDQVGRVTIWGNAPVLWLTWAGVPGLFFLLAREAALFAAARSMLRRAPAVLPVMQALVAIMAQELSYGSWMNPNYFVLAAMILASSAKTHGHQTGVRPIARPRQLVV